MVDAVPCKCCISTHYMFFDDGQSQMIKNSKPTICLHSGAGVADIIDSALEEGVPIALIGATCSGLDEGAISAASFALGARRSGLIHFFNCGEPVRSASPEMSDDSGAFSFEAAIAAAKAQVRSATIAVSAKSRLILYELKLKLDPQTLPLFAACVVIFRARCLWLSTVRVANEVDLIQVSIPLVIVLS